MDKDTGKQHHRNAIPAPPPPQTSGPGCFQFRDGFKGNPHPNTKPLPSNLSPLWKPEKTMKRNQALKTWGDLSKHGPDLANIERLARKEQVGMGQNHTSRKRKKKTQVFSHVSIYQGSRLGASEETGDSSLILKQLGFRAFGFQRKRQRSKAKLPAECRGHHCAAAVVLWQVDLSNKCPLKQKNTREPLFRFPTVCFRGARPL